MSENTIETPEGNNNRSVFWQGFVEQNIGNPDAIVSRLRLLEKQATTDTLTNLLNRRGLELQKDVFLASARRHNEEMLAFYFDVDDLKVLNSVSHKTGDDLLLRITAALRKTFRESDLLARVGGDEFVVLTPVKTNDEDTQIQVENIIGRLLHNLGNDQLSVGISIVKSKEDFEEALDRADRRMIIDKNTHKVKNGQ